MFDSYSSDQASTLFDDEMIEEGRIVDEDSTADSVQTLYHILQRQGYVQDSIIEIISERLDIKNVERYL